MCGVLYGAVITTIVAVAAVVLAAPSSSSSSSSSASETPSSINLFMPNVQPQQPDTYLCYASEVNEAHRYLTEFEPKADSHVAHHILLYGCEEPGKRPGEVWNCGEMSSESSSQQYPQSPVCSQGSRILYAWAMDAPKLHLPPDVGFDVGKDTPVKYLVVQVHYKNVSSFLPPENKLDNSGLTIRTSPTRTPKQAGVYLLATGGSILAKSIEYFEAACEYEEKEIVPFAFRTHAHSLGRVISGYRIRDGEWTEIGRKDPRLPEMFYNVTTPGMTIKKGDILAARCTMENTKDRTVRIGSTQDDEMCNFYVMFYVENPPLPTNRDCVSNGPPLWSWKDYADRQKINLKGVPATVSVIPGTEKPLVKTTENKKQRRNMQRFNSPFEDGLGGQTMGGSDEYLGPVEPGTYKEPSLEQLLDEAIDGMDPQELYYMVQELARDEQRREEEAKLQMLRERQRMLERNLNFP